MELSRALSDHHIAVVYALLSFSVSSPSTQRARNPKWNVIKIQGYIVFYANALKMNIFWCGGFFSPKIKRELKRILGSKKKPGHLDINYINVQYLNGHNYRIWLLEIQLHAVPFSHT